MEETAKNSNQFIFLSYSSENKNVADAIVADLEQHGIRCWYAPRDILPGQPWMGSIVEAIKRAGIIVLIYTEESNKSKQVMREMTLAFDNGKTIVPFKLSAADMNENLSYFLAGVHWMDAITPPLNKRIIELREKISAMLTDASASPARADKPNEEKKPSAEEARPDRTKQENTRGRKKVWLICLVCAVVLAAAGFAAKHFLSPQADVPAPTELPEASSLPGASPTPEKDTLLGSGSAGENIQWRLYTDGTLEIFGNGSMDDYAWDIAAARAIQPWDEFRDSITSVIVNDGVQYIGMRSFLQYSGVTSVTIPKSVTGIGSFAFLNCPNLTQFAVDQANPAYCSADGVLFNKAMTELLIYPPARPGSEYTVPDGVAEIGSFACCNLKTIQIPDSVLTLGNAAFEKCLLLEEIELPAGLSAIPANLFWNDKALKKVTIQTGVTSIAGDAFHQCAALKDVYYTGTEAQWNQIAIADGNDELTAAAVHFLLDSGSAGASCKWEMYSDGTLEITGTGKMDDCKWDLSAQKTRQPWDIYHETITSVVVGDGIQYIGECAFRLCYRTVSVTLPKTVTGIGWCAFTNCGGQFTVDPENPAYCAVDGVLFNKDMTELLIYPFQKPGDEYTVPDGVTEIDTFAYCKLKTLHLPDSVTTIHGSAFEGCDLLEELVLPRNLTKLSSYTFWGNDMLRSVTIQEGMERIDQDAFFICDALKDIYYTGTRGQWNQISIDSDNSDLNRAAIHYQGEE